MKARMSTQLAVVTSGDIVTRFILGLVGENLWRKLDFVFCSFGDGDESVDA
jgi:hypothetical protein